MNVSKETKAMLKVIDLLFYMTMYMHIWACIWFLVVKDKEEWIPNMDFIHFGTPAIYDFYHEYGSRQYFYALYTSFYLFGIGEMVPQNPLENLVASIALVLSSLINGFVIGNMALYLIELNRNNA